MGSLLDNIKRYFIIQEFVSEAVYNKYGEGAWRLIDTRILKNILHIRESLGLPITINTWHNNGLWEQRGYRENTCQIVKQKTKLNKLYTSAHTFGKALDFDVKGMGAEEVREWIMENGVPVMCRLEKDVNWVHMDVMPKITQKEHVYQFNA